MAAGSRRHSRQDEEPDHHDFDLQADIRKLDFDNIDIPPRDVGPGPVTRSRMRAAAMDQMETLTPQTNGGDDQQSDIGVRSDDSFVPQTKPTIHIESISAGPHAISALRKHIPARLLAKLPFLSEMKFSRHSKPAATANIRLLLGTFADRSLTRWGNPVYAYLRPNKNHSIGPMFTMEGDEEYGSGHNIVKISWDEVSHGTEVTLKPPFKQAMTYDELYAVVKYYFLLAVEARVEGFQHDFIPVNGSFVQHLTSLCQHYDPDLLTPESSFSEYSDDLKAPPKRRKERDRRRPPGYAERPGVARVKRNREDSDDTSNLNPAKSNNGTSVLRLYPLGEDEDRSPKFEPSTAYHDADDAEYRSKDDEGDGYVQIAFRYHTRGTSSPSSPYTWRDRGTVHKSFNQRANAPSGLEAISEEIELQSDNVSYKFRSTDRHRSSGTHQFAIDKINRPSNGFMRHGLEEKDTDFVATYGSQCFSRLPSDDGLFSLDRHSLEMDRDHTEMPCYAISEPMPVKHNHPIHWERLQASMSSSSRAFKERKERSISKSTLQSPNSFVDLRPSSTYNDLISSSLLREQRRVMNGRIEKAAQAVKSSKARLRRLYLLDASIGAEHAEKKRRENNKDDTEDVGEPPSPNGSA
ncbi:hypothetical protein GT037_009246 [Alternaria burnsii]|uniref:Uncharacterized protein n=1 Tax=Alternaria burnsii TaxID=1187904 RepID=A0A8H7AZY0_9PLEO|nr:uncharacterized protein GT037_009246 [Alternaria burnsii]KAF7672745.1 hypothetical protein GT037_009246 [Alternaria burnsii]